MRLKAHLLRQMAILPILIFTIFTTGCATRPKPPPKGMQVTLPFGAIDIDELHYEDDSAYQESIEQSFATEPSDEFDPDHDGISEYHLLALSGGGAYGAFGAGVLCGWTEEGTRPDFKVVSGVSTGALQATFAFLGSAYDDQLREIYTSFNSLDIYRKRWQLVSIFSDAVNDTWPLEELLEEYVTEDVFDAVAQHHKKGHRLFVATTNIETSELIIWDMGKIASSGQPGALEHYRRILLASSSVPVFFPPVYFEVEGKDGENYHEMHVDGGVFANLFFRGFMLDYEDAMQAAGIDMFKNKVSLYVIGNGRADDVIHRTTVPGKALAIARTSIEDLFKISNRGAQYRVYVLTHRNGIDFNLAQIPQDHNLDFSPVDFNQIKMQELFDLGLNLSKSGYPWLKAPQFLDPDEIIEISSDIKNE